MRVLVCGGRHYEDYDTMQTVLFGLQVYRAPITLLIHGEASGADRLAGRYARRHNIPEAPFPANWKVHKKSAGPIRNKQMLDQGRPDLVVAFPGGSGTADMVRQAKSAGVEVLEI